MFSWRRKNRFQQEAQDKKRGKRRRRLSDAQKTIVKQLSIGIGLFALLGALFYGIHTLTRLPGVTLVSVSVVGGKTIESEIIIGKVETELTGDYFRLIPKRFTYLYPKERITEVVATIDRVKHVHVERVSRTELVVAFEEYVPYALWCTLGDAENCFFIDTAGFAFTKAPELRGGALVRYETIGSDPELNTQGFSAEEMDFTRWFIDALETALELYVISVAVDVEGDAHFTLSGGGQLIVSMREDQQDTFENLLTILGSDEFAHLEPGNFQYIDLRFGNKIFVNEELTPTEAGLASSTATSTP